MRTTSNNKRQKQSPLKWALIVSGVVVLLLSTGTFALWTTGSGPFSPDSSPLTDAPTQEQLDEEKQQNANDKQDFLDGQVGNDGEPNVPPVSDGDISLTAKTEDNSLVVSANLASIGSGTCELKLEKDTAQLERLADVIYTPSYSTCAGFDVPISQLSTGTWTISLSVSQNGTSIASKTINYEI
jgi:hypothetical protein